MGWNMNHRDAMAEAARCDIPPADADRMWTKYTELALAVRDGKKADKAASSEFAAFCAGLATVSALTGATPSQRKEPAE
jgi:hypothetical protein